MKLLRNPLSALSKLLRSDFWSEYKSSLSFYLFNFVIDKVYSMLYSDIEKFRQLTVKAICFYHAIEQCTFWQWLPQAGNVVKIEHLGDEEKITLQHTIPIITFPPKSTVDIQVSFFDYPREILGVEILGAACNNTCLMSQLQPLNTCLLMPSGGHSP